MERVVGVSEYAVSTSSDDVLITYSLGSCIGLALFDPAVGVGGMLHAMMPLSAINPERAKSQPAMFVDTGVTALLQLMFAHGARRHRLVATVAGGGRQMDDSLFFRIGERNYTVVRRLLWKNQIFVAAEDIGGARSRTITLDMSNGQTVMKSDGRTKLLATAVERE